MHRVTESGGEKCMKISPIRRRHRHHKTNRQTPNLEKYNKNFLWPPHFFKNLLFGNTEKNNYLFDQKCNCCNWIYSQTNLFLSLTCNLSAVHLSYFNFEQRMIPHAFLKIPNGFQSQYCPKCVFNTFAAEP